MQKDNSTGRQKIALRRQALQELNEPATILETHGGYVLIWETCYMECGPGVVFEKNPKKSSVLARQRPTWAVYEAECSMALRAGVGKEWPINFIDCDPYGEPWPALAAFFHGSRSYPSRLALVVNDGLRQKLKINGGWDVKSIVEIVDKYGANATYGHYLDICQEKIEELAALQGYVLQRWSGYYCGFAKQMTHYAAIFTR